MKHLKVRVNNSLHDTVVLDGIPRQIEHVRFARSFNPPPINSIIDDMLLQQNPDDDIVGDCCYCGLPVSGDTGLIYHEEQYCNRDCRRLYDLYCADEQE